MSILLRLLSSFHLPRNNPLLLSAELSLFFIRRPLLRPLQPTEIKQRGLGGSAITGVINAREASNSAHRFAFYAGGNFISGFVRKLYLGCTTFCPAKFKIELLINVPRFSGRIFQRFSKM